MIDRLGRAARPRRAIDAYLLISVAGDLRISEIVDQPNWIVTCYVPTSIFALTSAQRRPHRMFGCRVADFCT